MVWDRNPLHQGEEQFQLFQFFSFNLIPSPGNYVVFALERAPSQWRSISLQTSVTLPLRQVCIILVLVPTSAYDIKTYHVVRCLLLNRTWAFECTLAWASSKQAPNLACCRYVTATVAVPPLGGRFIWIIGRMSRPATDWRLSIIFNQAQLDWRRSASAEPPTTVGAIRVAPPSLPPSCM